MMQVTKDNYFFLILFALFPANLEVVDKTWVYGCGFKSGIVRTILTGSCHFQCDGWLVRTNLSHITQRLRRWWGRSSESDSDGYTPPDWGTLPGCVTRLRPRVGPDQGQLGDSFSRQVL
jgi:hypothetical protein